MYLIAAFDYCCWSLLVLKILLLLLSHPLLAFLLLLVSLLLFRFCQKFSQAMDEVEIFFCQFLNPWALRVSGMGCYTSKCEKKLKSLHPNKYAYLYIYDIITSQGPCFQTIERKKCQTSTFLNFWMNSKQPFGHPALLITQRESLHMYPYIKYFRKLIEKFCLTIDGRDDEGKGHHSHFQILHDNFPGKFLSCVHSFAL